MTPRKLSLQEAAFCRAYVLDCDRNGAEAARKAGYSVKGASVASAKLMRRQHVRDEIARLEGEVLKRTGTVNQLLASVSAGADRSEPASPGSIADQIRNETDANVIAALARAYVLAAVKENLDICLGRRKRRTMKSETVLVEDTDTGKKVKRKVLVEIEIYDPNPSAANAAAVILLNAPEISGKQAGTDQPEEANAAMLNALKEFE